MKTISAAQASVCPVCASHGRALLALPGQPIYQHPVALDVTVPAPHSVDLEWIACVDCAHAWQPAFDAEVLAGIYRSFYYTPAPDGIAVQFRNDFLEILSTFGIAGPRRVLLEVGSSSGEVLEELKTRTGAERAYAFEPNSENAVLARQRGLDVRERFFSGGVAQEEKLDAADLIYARHVIEHIFDFNDFFAALNAVAAPTADLVLETPSLDFHAQRGSIDPFHVEHIHVFGLRSLARLASLHGWGLRNAHVTSSGNLIAAFRQGAALSEVPAPPLEHLQQAVAERRRHLQTLFGGRTLLFWGAGSAGVNLVSTLGREPELWTDGNPNKVGKRFIGLTRQIVSPESALARAQSGEFGNPALVVASSFVDEIVPRVRQLGWRGEVFDAAGNPR